MTTQTKFTPGPWSIWGPCHEGEEFATSSQKPGYEVVARGENASVAWVDWDRGDDEAKTAAQADARLIAQAPAMYALLASIRDAYSVEHGDTLSEGFVARVREVLAAAAEVSP